MFEEILIKIGEQVTVSLRFSPGPNLSYKRFSIVDFDFKFRYKFDQLFDYIFWSY